MSYLRDKLPEAEADQTVRDELFQREPWRKMLWDAAERIALRGHCKHQLCDQEDRNCVMGAVYKVNRNGLPRISWPDDDAVKAIDRFGAAVLTEHQRCSPMLRHVDLEWTAVQWNNAEERTAEQVINKLREVALGAS